jgi:mannan endo-1,4-beta-mannosidase
MAVKALEYYTKLSIDMMKSSLKYLFFASFILLMSACSTVRKVVPVNKKASKEAKALLNYLYKINGKKTLYGMHNIIGGMSKTTDSIYRTTGDYPAIWGGDFGFADENHDIDNIKYRPLLVPEIKKQYARGSIIVMSYHQANPFLGEPTPFKGGIISQLTDDQWKELTTPGTPLYKKWAVQMDLIAVYFKELQEANIPVIFRPYHEMNGNWFWWGHRKGDDGFKALWHQLYNYYTNHHQLNNILWAWTSDKPWDDVADYYPNDNTVDILGCDIYPMKDTAVVYRQEFYDRMLKLANGKPLALTENSVLLSKAELKNQPWAWMMSWGQMVFETNTKEEIKGFLNQKQMLMLEDLPHKNKKHK